MGSLPIVGMFSNKISDVYCRTKNNTGIIAKTIVMAEAVTCSFAEKVAPLAPTTALSKIDALACKGFETIEHRVPQMKKQPDEMVKDTRELITTTMAPVVLTVERASDVVCKTLLAQKACDLVGYMLGTASKTLDVVLPPSEQEKSEQNGTVSGALEPVEPEKRPYQLVRGAWTLCCVFTKRLFGVAHARVEHAAATTDVVIKSAQNAFSRPTNTS